MHIHYIKDEYHECYRLWKSTNPGDAFDMVPIEKIEPYFNGGLLLELKGGEKIEVSRRQTVKFKEMMSL